jgi:pilus assembly protein Flp/PilA
MIKKLISFFKDEEGASMVEYGLLVALIAVVCITAVALVGTNLSNKFSTVAGNISSAS